MNTRAKNKKFDNLLHASDKLAVARKADDVLGALQDVDLLRATRHAAQFRATLDGKDVTLRMVFSPDAVAHTQTQAAKLDALSSRMSDGKYRVPHLVAVRPAFGATLTEYIDGTSLEGQIALADTVAVRRVPIRAAAQWLAHLTQDERSTGGLAARHWLRQRLPELSKIDHPRDVDLAKQLALQLDVLCATVHGSEVTRAITHGDFTAANLISGRDALYGVDIKNTHSLPIVRDLARFLVHLSVTQPGTGRVHIAGIQKADFEALCHLPELISAEERDRLMPYFIGIELAERYSRMKRGGKNGANIRDVITRFLDDTRAA